MTTPSKTNQDLIEEISILKTENTGLEQSESERKRASEALRESEEYFKAIIQNSSDIILIVDKLGTITYASPSVERFLGYGPDELIGKRTLDLIVSDDKPRAIADFGRALLIKEVLIPNVFRIRHKNGTERILEGIGKNLLDNPIVAGFVMNVRDITERKQAEEALRESEERLRDIMFSMADWVWEVDENGVYTYSSQKGFDLFGGSREDIIGKTPFDFMPPDEAKRVAAIFSEIVANKAPIKDLENWNIRKNGERICLLTNGVPILDKEGNLKGYRGVDKDITERKRAEEEKRSLEERLQRAEKMEALGQLAGGVAHDLNNVLGILSGYSELLLVEIPEGHRSRGHAEKILQSTEKGAAIIQDLLTLARRGVTASDVINLNSVVSGFLKTPVFEKMKDYHPRVTFRTECDKNLLNIKGSPVHLEKTLMNLVSNAAESISGKGEVTIRTESRYLDKAIRGYDEVKEGDYAVLTVSDTGMGIPAENREKIFEPFYTKKTMGRSGTGLGLAIVWGTVKDHNGYIDVQTEVGEGTTFTLYFPVTREELIAPQQKVPIERYMGKGESVLVVDDIAEQRDVASRLLTRLGYEVHVVSSGEEAVEYLKGNKADILVLDMIMAPGIDGLETYQRVLEINPKQKAILVSGFSETDRVREAQKLGAGAYVKKPYVMEKIGVAIRDELNR